MAVNRVKNVVMIVVCIFAMGTCVPVIRLVNETAGVIGIVVCALVLVRFLIPLIEDIRGKKWGLAGCPPSGVDSNLYSTQNPSMSAMTDS